MYSTFSLSNATLVADEIGGPNRGFIAKTGASDMDPPHMRRLSTMRIVCSSSPPDSTQHTKVMFDGTAPVSLFKLDPNTNKIDLLF
jgi:hypothetical protein